MKATLILLALTGAGYSQLHAQTIKTMTEQLVTLKMLEQTVQKGYQLVIRHQQQIGDSQQGDYQNHSGYFKSLRTVNPNIYSPVKTQNAKTTTDWPAQPDYSNSQTPIDR